ncbi:LuxR C-terminal-related transcriptional regulator [Sphaerisporangium melleum]|uniref:helix-turn-helix transcriptional regulator n=1 Tax=Sphaerisporangium melleum TaxID=321316 RepID=UPI00194F2FA6|nr:LuxR C-terminal-related transcriptional regulator [Sphaerisporangium melleum]
MGRDTELKAFEAALDETGYHGFLIFGEPGVGKTRLAEECLAVAAQRGHAVARAVATCAAAEIPLGAIAHLLPDGVDLSDPVAGFATAVRLMSRAYSATANLVLLIDDLHLLDTASALLLRQLMETGAVFLMGTVRSDASSEESVATLGRGDAVHHADLAPLTWRQVHELLQHGLAGHVHRETVDRLHAASGGNPLYLRELVRGALAEGRLTNDGEIWQLATTEFLPVTRRLTDLIRRRLATVAPCSRRLLDLLALCGSVSVADLESNPGTDVLDELERAELVTVVREGRRTYARLAHPLYAEVLPAGIPEGRRREMLRELADRLEQTGARRREDAMRLASYRLAGTGTADPALLLQAAQLAAYGDDHARVLDFLQAIPENARTFPALLLLGRTLSELGRPQEAEAMLCRADRWATTESRALAVALARTRNLIWARGVTREEAVATNDAARDRVTSAAGRWALRVNEANMLSSLGHHSESIDLLDGMPDGEPPAGDIAGVATWTAAAATRASALSFLARSEEAVHWAERAVTLCVEARAAGRGHAPQEAAALSALVLALTESGRLEEARVTAERAYTDPGAAPTGWQRTLLVFPLARNALMAGRPASARRWYAEIVRDTRPQAVILRPLALAGLAAAAALQGDVRAAKAALAEHAGMAAPVHVPEERLGEAWTHVALGDQEAARTVLRAAAAEAREREQFSSETMLLTDLARLGVAAEVAGRLAELARTAGPFTAARARLAAALAAGDRDGLTAVAADFDRMGANLLAAEAASAAAELWRRSGNPRQATAAAARAAAGAALCEGACTPMLQAADAAVPLTAREREIAALAAEGMFSKDIAAKLTISVRTVDNHLQRVYAKLGVTNRRELTGRLGHKPD